MTDVYWQGFSTGGGIVLAGVLLGICLSLWLHRGL